MHYCATCGSRYDDNTRFCPLDGQSLQELPEADMVDPLIGSVVDGRYRIEGLLGEGGMGVVYEVTHQALNKRLALKVLRGEMATDEVVVQRFVQEAQSASAIGHPNIVDISDFGTMADGSAFFVMEYLEGESLSDRMSREPLRPSETLGVLEQVSSALAAAHARGIVHRDLKPDNIQLIPRANSELFVKILDFGIAKVGGANSKLTRTGTVFGTPHYMSPEQAAGQSVDARADIYALGVILYEMLTGKVPFEGDTFMGILSKHMFEAPPPLHAEGRDIGGFEPIVTRCMAKRPQDRYDSMDALLADAAVLRQGGTLQSVVPAAPTPQLQALAAKPKSAKKGPWVALGAVVLLLIAGAGVGALIALEGDPLEGQEGAGVAALEQAPSVPEFVQTTAAVQPEPAVEPSPDGPSGAASPSAGEAGEEAPEQSPEVLLQSEPEGAEVFFDDALIGTTPLSIPRPQRPMLVRITAAGHQARMLTLRPMSDDVVLAHLSRNRRPTTMRPTTRPAPEPTTEPAPAPAAMNNNRIGNEVVDPWAH